MKSLDTLPSGSAALSQTDKQVVAKRDVQLDIYRALSMIYILCVIHVAYWLDAVPEPFASVLLFEMPVIFFISGAALSVSKKRKKFTSVVTNRAKRVLLPYYAYAFACVAVFAAYYLLFDTDRSEPLVYVVIRSLWPDDGSVPVPYAWHLWFVAPYLIISCSFYFQQKLTDRINPYIYLSLLLIACVITQILTGNSLIRSVIFYNFFFMAGYLMYKRLSKSRICLIATVAIPVLAAMFFYFWKGSMQAHKFPCDMVFLVFGIVALCLLGLIFTYVRVPANRLLNWWNKNGYTIYMWQNIAFIIAGVLLIVLPSWLTISYVGFTVKAIMIFLLSTFLSFLAVPFERLFAKAIARIFTRSPRSACLVRLARRV